MTELPPLPRPELFSLEKGVIYLDNAAVSPIPKDVENVSLHAVSSKAQPWRRDRELAHSIAFRLRELSSLLIGAQPQDMAIVNAVSYGIAVARENLPVRAGERILLLEGDHTSQVLTWTEHALRFDAVIDTVKRPSNGDWTGAILEHLSHSNGARIAIASFGETFWIDGSRVDLAVVCRALRERAAAVVLDLTQSVGMLDADVYALDADFAVFPMYKWLLGPYSMALLYVAPRWQEGLPLEQNSFNRDASGDFAPGAQRFDMGERDAFVSIPTAVAALELATSWSRAALRAHVAQLTGTMTSSLLDVGLTCIESRHRSPHILGVGGAPEGLAQACRSEGVFFTQRRGILRISPHIFNTLDDAQRCAAVISKYCIRARAGKN